MNRLSHELAEAMAAAVSDDHRVEACREKARAAGYSMRVSLEAVIGFADRSKTEKGVKAEVAVAGVGAERRPRVMSSNDRRFLRSLRIAADEVSQQTD